MSESEEASAGASAIVVVDPDPNSRNNAEDLEDELDRQIIAIDSTDFDIEASEEILSAAAFIITWDLGIRSGADLIEELRAHPELGDKPILIAADAPTKEMVCWAIAMGADAVCLRPYEAEEVSSRLALLEEAAGKAA